jgi:hypothetical protein
MSFEIIKECTTIVSPLFLNCMIEYFDGKRNIQWALGFGALICLSFLLGNCVQHYQVFKNKIYGMQIRTVCNALVYSKLMRIQVKQAGLKIDYLNLLATDAASIELMTTFFPYLIVGPLKTLIVAVILATKVSHQMLSGLLVFLLMVPVQFGLSHLFVILK